MALVAHNNTPLAAHKIPRSRYCPAHTSGSHPPFLYTGPKLQTSSGSRKARKVLGLVAEFERRHSPASSQSSSSSANKAQRTLGLVTELPRDRTSWSKSPTGLYQGTLEQKLAQAEEHVRRLSRQQGIRQQKEDENGSTADDELSEEDIRRSKQPKQPVLLEADEDVEPFLPDDPEKSSFLRVSLQESPQQLEFPTLPIELDAGPDHELLLPPPRPRIRPHSYTSPRFSDRPTNKIASSRSRGLRAYSSPPNFSRPLSSCIPTPVPGEDMERDPLFLRLREIELDPRSPISPIGGESVSNEIKEAREKVEKEKSRMRAMSPPPVPASPSMPPSPWAPIPRNKKTRWSSLPLSLMKFAARRRTSKTEEENRDHTKEAVTLTEENLQRWEDEVGYVPKMYRLGYDVLRSPVEMDMEVERSTPIPPTSHTPSPQMSREVLLTPPASPPLHDEDRHSSAGSTLRAFPAASQRFTPLPTAVALSSAASSANPFSPGIRSSTTSTLIRRFPSVPRHPLAQPTLAAQKEALSHKPTNMLTCALCKEVEHPSAFPLHPLTETCLHAARTCKECVQHWIEACAEARGWEGCSCPECGVAMSWEEVKIWVPEHVFGQ